MTDLFYGINVSKMSYNDNLNTGERRIRTCTLVRQILFRFAASLGKKAIGFQMRAKRFERNFFIRTYLQNGQTKQAKLFSLRANLPSA